jgi:hypothetical protein
MKHAQKANAIAQCLVKDDIASDAKAPDSITQIRTPLPHLWLTGVEIAAGTDRIEELQSNGSALALTSEVACNVG